MSCGVSCRLPCCARATPPGDIAPITSTAVTSMAAVVRATTMRKVLRNDESERPIEQALGVALINAIALGVRDVAAADDLDGFTDVHRAALGIERRVARENDLIGTEKAYPTLGRRSTAEHGRIGPEHLEIVVGTLLQGFAQAFIVLVGRARAELVQPVAD